MSNTDELWALVHGQLDDKEAARVREELKTNRELQQQYRQIQNMDELLHMAGPSLELKEDDLEKKVLHAWEASPESGSWSVTAHDVPTQAKVLRFPVEAMLFLKRPRRALQAAAALAACILVVVGARNYFSPSLAWRPDELQTIQYRGESPAGAEKPGDDMKALAHDLRAAIGSQYEQGSAGQTVRSVFKKRTAWILSTKIQALPENLLSVQVEAYRPRDKTLVGVWAKVYESREDFSREIPTLSKQIVTDLRRLRLPKHTP